MNYKLIIGGQMSQMTKKIVFVVLLLLGILKLILISVTGNFLGMVSYSSWMIYVLIILFLIFLWFFYGFAFKSLYSLKFLLMLLVGIAVFVCILGFSTKAMKIGNSEAANFNGLFHTYKKTDSSTKSSGGLVSCTSTVADSPTTISGYKFAMFAQPVDYSGYADNGTRTFSVKSLDAKTGEDIFFHIEKSDGGYITGVKGLIEVCDSNNMTKKYSSTADSTTVGAGDTAQGSTYYMHGNKKVTLPGTYRVDGYANVDGSWKLVGRISDITVTE